MEIIRANRHVALVARGPHKTFTWKAVAMLVLTVEPHSFVVIQTSDGDVKIYNNDTIRQRVGYDAPKNVKILREKLVGNNNPPPRRAA